MRSASRTSYRTGQGTQWYFQRYVAQLPSAGELIFFDRSWYNRAGVEKVMGFCTDTEYADFARTVPEFERMLQRAGILYKDLTPEQIELPPRQKAGKYVRPPIDSQKWMPRVYPRPKDIAKGSSPSGVADASAVGEAVDALPFQTVKSKPGKKTGVKKGKKKKTEKKKETEKKK